MGVNYSTPATPTASGASAQKEASLPGASLEREVRGDWGQGARSTLATVTDTAEANLALTRRLYDLWNASVRVQRVDAESRSSSSRA